MYIAPILQYILGMDVLKGLTIATTSAKFHLWVYVVKTTIIGHLHHEAVILPNRHRVAVLPLRGHEEIRGFFSWKRQRSSDLYTAPTMLQYGL